MKTLHVATSPLTARIYAGTVLKDGKTWGSNKRDVTGEACAAVAHHALSNGGTITVTANGAPAYEITVRELAPNAEGKGPRAVPLERPVGRLTTEGKMMTETQQQVVKWLATGSVGMSSKCMAMWLAFGERTKPCAPADPDDLDRCLKLLDKAPGLRPLMSKMAEVSKDWAALVPRWDEVEASHLAEVGLGRTKANRAPKTYELMASILRPRLVPKPAPWPEPPNARVQPLP